jgi:HD-GYP domain-containing protein (c-di-GMP phosphodiesterase class II)
MRTTGIYDSMNETILNIAGRLKADTEPLLEDTGEITIKMIEGSFYIEGIRVKAGISEVESFSILAAELGRRSVGIIDFREPLTVEDLINFAYAIKNSSDASDIQSDLEGRLAKSISIGGPVALQREESIDLTDNRAVARRAYVKALSAFREVDNSLKAGRRLKLKKIKRSLQLLVDCVLADETYISGFAALRHHENYSFFHPVNVAVLSVLLGKKIGLSRVVLRTLALTAFFHDAGKIGIPGVILNKKEDFSAREMELIKRHPIEGVKIFLKSFGLNETTILAMIVSYEHHMRTDLSGYPPASEGRRPNLLSRIVSIADDFDSLVSGKVYERKKLDESEALTLMLSERGSSYDPLLMKAFAGIFT